MVELKWRKATEEEMLKPARTRRAGKQYNEAVDKFLLESEYKKGITIEMDEKDTREPSTIAWGISGVLKKRKIREKYEILTDSTNRKIIVRPKQTETKFSFPIRKLHSLVTYDIITIPKAHRHNFPNYNESFILETNIGEFNRHIATNNSISGMKRWHKENNTKQADVIEFTIIEDKKQYRLNLIKGEKVE